MADIPLVETRAAGNTGHVTDTNIVHSHINAEIIEAADWGVDAANHATANGNALRQCVADSAARFTGGYHIRLPHGLLEFDAVAQNTNNLPSLQSGGAATVALHDNSTLEIPAGCTMKLMGQSTSHGVTGAVPYPCRFLNHTGTTGIKFIGHGIVDGNAVQLTSDNRWAQASAYAEGATLWRTQNSMIKDLTFKNWMSTYGNAGTATNFGGVIGSTKGEEAFQVNVKRSIWTIVDNVTMLSTATRGLVSGGIHVDNCTFIRISNSRWDNVDVQGISVYGSSNVALDNCIATRNKRGFNFEHSWNIQMDNCIAGGFIVRDSESATPDVFQSNVDPVTGVAWTDGQSMANHRNTSPGSGNGVGIHIIFGGTSAPGSGVGKGGGNYHFTNCIIQGHGLVNGQSDAGFTMSDLVMFQTTASGNTGTAIASTKAIFTQGMVGQYVQVGTDQELHVIEAVSSSTAATLHTALSGTQNSQPAVVYPGLVKFDNCTFMDNNRHFALQGGSSTSCNTTNGSTTVTAVTGTPWSSDDLGKYISGTGILLNTYITAVNSSSSITISAIATATGTPTLSWGSGGRLSRIIEFNDCTFSGQTAGTDAYDLGPMNNSVMDLSPGSDITTLLYPTVVAGSTYINWAPCKVTVYAPGNTGISIGNRYTDLGNITALGAVASFDLPAGGFFTVSGTPSSTKAIVA